MHAKGSDESRAYHLFILDTKRKEKKKNQTILHAENPYPSAFGVGCCDNDAFSAKFEGETKKDGEEYEKGQGEGGGLGEDRDGLFGCQY